MFSSKSFSFLEIRGKQGDGGGGKDEDKTKIYSLKNSFSRNEKGGGEREENEGVERRGCYGKMMQVKEGVVKTTFHLSKIGKHIWNETWGEKVG